MYFFFEIMFIDLLFHFSNRVNMSLRTILERLALYSVASMLFIDSMIKLFPKLIPERTAVLVNAYFNRLDNM